jgi:hypothetical protein
MLLKTISRSNALPTKILIVFDRNRKINPKIHMETQKVKNRQSNLEQKEQCCPTTISDLIMTHRSEGSLFKALPGKTSQPEQTVCKNLSQKYLTQQRAVGVAHMVENLPSKSEAMDSKPSTTKNGDW